MTNDTTGKAKVLYIAGMGRSGSTILGRLLGELPDTVHVGEIGLFSGNRFQETARCECRERVTDCPFWQAVFERAFGGLNALDLVSLQETRRAYRLRSLPSLLLPSSPRQIQGRQEYRAVLSALYQAIQEVSGAKVIVDGSKDVLYGYLLSQSPAVDMQAVHLIRDSRAVAFSYQRVKTQPPQFAGMSALPRFPAWQTALSWKRRHSAAGRVLGAAVLAAALRGFCG